MPDDIRGRLFEFIAERCSVVVIVSHDIDKAHRTFVVLNERGKQLQRDDILKADILSRVPASDINWIAETWDRDRRRAWQRFRDLLLAHPQNLRLR